jgi:HCO3- transporter family
VDYCTKPDISDFLHNLTFSGEEADFSTGNMTKEVPSSSSQTFNAEPNTAFSSFILQFGTFWIANNLKIFRNGKTLGRKVIFC